MGGRMCSMAVADGLPAAALVLVSYPLHPPGKPDRLRTEHFPALTCPVSSCRGPATPSAPRTSSNRPPPPFPGAVTHVWIDGGDHGLRSKTPRWQASFGTGSPPCADPVGPTMT